ncbi:MAG: EI24 domain-containing protein [Nitrosomonas sp.]|nr:EI24 domain-containing protein [Nitrosomonas sp.]MBP6075159.1 EI24 domain-containing protein [Nitrosomonas sp.]
MSPVFKAIKSTFRDLIRFKIAWIVVWPILVATLFWFAIGYIFWDNFSELIYQVFVEIGIGEWLKNVEPGWIAVSIQGLLHVIVFVPLVIMTTLIITTIFVMPALIKLVANRYYPELKREHGGTFSGSIINAILASGIFILIWVITLPLWTIGAGIIIPFVTAAFMNQQLFRYDALSEHASKQEIKTICVSNRYSLWGLGLLTGLIQFVPLLNLLAPIFTALTFIHFGLEHLKLLRAQNERTLLNIEHL